MAMAPSGGRPRSNLSERQLVGLFSLGLGVVLFVLILVRGQQAAREGNQEIRNDTYWVLVSPLVFSAFGLALLRSPGSKVVGRGRGSQPVVMRPQMRQQLEESRRTVRVAEGVISNVDEKIQGELAQARAEAASAQAALKSLQNERNQAVSEAVERIQSLEQELAQVQRKRAQLDEDLRSPIVTQSGSAIGAVEVAQSLEGQLDLLAGSLRDQLSASRQQLDQLVASQEEQVNRLRRDSLQATVVLDQLRTDQDARFQQSRAEAMAMLQESLQAIRNDRELALADAQGRMQSLRTDLSKLEEACGQFESQFSRTVQNLVPEGTLSVDAVETASLRFNDLGRTFVDQLGSARELLERLTAKQEEQFALLREESIEARSALERLRLDHQNHISHLRSEANAVVASAVSELDSERSRLTTDTLAQIDSLTAQLHNLRGEWERLEADLHRSATAQAADADVTQAANRRIETQLDALSSGLRDQLETSRRQLEQLIAAQETDLKQLQLDAVGARTSLDQFSADQDARLGELRLQAAAAIRSAQESQSRTQAVAETVAQQMATMDQQIQQAQQRCHRAEATLSEAVTSTGKAQAESVASAAQAQRRVEELANSLSVQMDQARNQLNEALQASQEAQTLVERLEQTAFSAPVSAAAPASSDPFLSSYREACEELGVLPGSPWQEVRATWRRNLMHWHPDQGGDSRLWVRRNAAYQLLVAWYDFNGAS